MTTKRTLTDLVKTTFREEMKKVGTSIPGHIVAFNSTTQLAQVQIGIVRIDVNGQRFEPPPLISCPVHFTGGTDYILEHEINPDDECLIIFSQRCIDDWVNSGGIANNPILRYHEFDDAMIIMGLRSQPNKISSFENNGIRLRNKDGDKFIWLKNDGTGEITVDTLKINGNIEHTGDQITSGTINAQTAVESPSIIVDGKELKNHTHGGVTSGNANTGPNN